MLILSFIPIAGDPRVMKQVHRLAQNYEVTTCSPGGAPDADVTHVELHDDYVPRRTLVGRVLDEAARRTERFSRLYFQMPSVIQTGELLRGRSFDAVIANDAETVGIAIRLFGAERVHADLHEFFPDMGFEDSPLGRRQQRYWTWMTQKLVAPAASSSTVGSEIAKLYRNHGLDPLVVTNSTHFRDLQPSPVSSPIRLVYSGNAFKAWGLPEIMHAVARSEADVTLDLLLTHYVPVDRAYLVDLADTLGPRITVREPVTQAELVETLNDFDLGIFVLPPKSPNSALALPNKFFDYVQARLGIIVGPSIEMAQIVRARGLGVVSSSFEIDDIKVAVDALTPTAVEGYKAATAASAPELSSDTQVEVWAGAVAAIVERAHRGS